MKKIITLATALLLAAAATAQNADDYRDNAARGDAQAQFLLGQCYEKGLGVTPDTTVAIQWYTKAAEQDHPDALYSLGLAYYYASGVAEDLNKARALLRKAIATGKLDRMKVYSANALLGNFPMD